LAVLSFATAFGAAVPGSFALEVGIVCVGYPVAIRIRCGSVIGVVWIGVVRVIRTVSVSICVVWVGPCLVLFQVVEAIPIGIGASIAGGERVEAVVDLPTVWHAVVVGICVVHVCASTLLLCVGQPIPVPIGSSVRGVQGV
jgi:hypothetical protein